MISRVYTKVLAGDRARYAALAAPSLALELPNRHVVRLAR
jgi:hypothetical protein